VTAVTGPPRKRPEIVFLAFAELIVSADPAVDGNLSQLDPSEINLRKCREYALFELRSWFRIEGSSGLASGRA
jgi:hypothetical protein